MTKKQILATCLAGALTLGCVSGCANKKMEDIILAEEEQEEGYVVNTTMACVRLTENGTVEYVAPGPDWILLGDKCYQVMYRKIITSPVEFKLEDGGTLGCSEYLYSYQVVNNPTLRNEIIAKYAEKQEANKKTLK